MGENFDKAKLDDVAQMIQRYEHLSDMAYVLAVPPARSQTVNGIRSATVCFDRSATGEIHPVVTNTRSLATPTAQTIGRSSINMCSS